MRRPRGTRRQGITLLQTMVVLTVILIVLLGMLDTWAVFAPTPILIGAAAALGGTFVFWCATGDRGHR